MKRAVAFLIALTAWIVWYGSDAPMDHDPVSLRDAGLL